MDKIICAHPLLEALSQYLELKDVFSLQRVSKSFNRAFSSPVFGLGSGYSCFRRFLDHPEAFRRVLQCGAVITGPLVFQYFAKQYVDDVEIDILVSYDQSHTVTQHLQQSEGYEMVDEECSPFTETLKVCPVLSSVDAGSNLSGVEIQKREKDRPCIGYTQFDASCFLPDP